MNGGEKSGTVQDYVAESTIDIKNIMSTINNNFLHYDAKSFYPVCNYNTIHFSQRIFNVDNFHYKDNRWDCFVISRSYRTKERGVNVIKNNIKFGIESFSFSRLRKIRWFIHYIVSRIYNTAFTVSNQILEKL